MTNTVTLTFAGDAARLDKTLRQVETGIAGIDTKVSVRAV